MYTDNKHPLTHKFLIIRDDKTIISTDSSSESISGSMMEDSNKDFESSEVDSEDLEDYANEQLPEQAALSSEKQCLHQELQIKSEETNSVTYANNHNYFIKQEEEETEDYNSQVDNISYDYLHSNLFLDET